MNRFWPKIAACALCAFLASSPAHAISLHDIDGKTDAQLAQENWETRQIKANSSTVKCGFWSILLSTVWRGYGHYCIGDDSSHYKLLAMEGASVLMMASAAIIGSLSHDDSALSPVWKSLFHFGTTLFVSSYIFDVFGTFKGDSFTLDANHLNPYGHALDVEMRWLPSQNFNLGIQLGYAYRTPRFWINPHGYLDVTGFDEYSIGLDVGVAAWYAERTHTYVAVAVDAKFEDNLSDSYRTLKVLPYIEFSLDLGTWFDHLAEFRFVNRLGIGVNLYDFEISGLTPFSDNDLLLVLETSISMNLIKELNLAVTYRYRPEFTVGQISAPSRIFDTVPVPGVGIFSVDLNFAISNGWFASVAANFGSSIDFWLGASKSF